MEFKRKETDCKQSRFDEQFFSTLMYQVFIIVALQTPSCCSILVRGDILVLLLL